MLSRTENELVGDFTTRVTVPEDDARSSGVLWLSRLFICFASPTSSLEVGEASDLKKRSEASQPNQRGGGEYTLS